jgi:hypothetical protein
MSNIIENHDCFFCDIPYPHPSCFISNYNDIWVCSTCENCEMNISIHNFQGNGECCICLEDKPLIKFATCIHTACLNCYKTIYFGLNRPIHWREMTDVSPDWPYEINEDDDNDLEKIKQIEYEEFEAMYFNIKENSYDELVTIRNNLISERSEWMNSDAFINYENGMFKYFSKFVKECKMNDENKTKGNSSCPLCRA